MAAAKSVQRRGELETERLGSAGLQSPHHAHEPVPPELLPGGIRCLRDAVGVQNQKVSLLWLHGGSPVLNAGEEPERRSDRRLLRRARATSVQPAPPAA